MQDDDSLVATSPQGSLLVSDDRGVVGTPAFAAQLYPGNPGLDSVNNSTIHYNPYGTSDTASNQPTSSSNWSSGQFTMKSIFSPFGSSTSTSNSNKQNQNFLTRVPEESKEESIDFIHVQETDADEVDILLAGGDPGTGQIVSGADEPPLDALAVLLSGGAHDDSEQLVSLSEQATAQMHQAVQAKKMGNMRKALDAHSAAARLFHEAAMELRDRNASMARSFLLLSQTEAKSAMGLKRIMKVRPDSLRAATAQQDRIRETVRGAMNSQPEADLSESVFLGRAKSDAPKPSPTKSSSTSGAQGKVKEKEEETSNEINPIDEMMKLERELKEMDLALEMGNSIASLDAKSRMKGMDGSFMVVPPGSNSTYMSSSMILSQQHLQQQQPARNTTGPVSMGTAGVRARANRVQPVAAPRSVPQVIAPPATSIASPPPSSSVTNRPSSNGLESSWWGSSGAASSQILTNSVISLASVAPGMDPHVSQKHHQQQPTNNKQLIRLMDSLKRLGDENAALLREVEQAEAARAEAKAARQEMKRFKQEYAKRFDTVKSMLEKIRQNYKEQGEWNQKDNPVLNSEYLINSSTRDQLSRQEQLIRKLTADLKREKEEARQKEKLFKNYEEFYRTVKKKSQEKAQRRQEANRARQGGS